MIKDIAYLISYLIVVIALVLVYILFPNPLGIEQVIVTIMVFLTAFLLMFLLLGVIASDLHHIVKYLAVGLFFFPFIVGCSNSKTNIQYNEEERIQIVNGLYWLYPVVFYEGTAIDTIEVAEGYHTYGIGGYTIDKGDCYAIRDTNQLTTIISYGSLREIARGRQMRIEDYEGPHGTINVFSFIDENGKRVRRDFYSEDVDEKSYTVHIRNELDYLINTY